MQFSEKDYNCESKHKQLVILYLHQEVVDKVNQAYSEDKHSLTFRVRRYFVTAMKPVHLLQIRSIMHNYGHPLPFPQVTSGSVQ